MGYIVQYNNCGLECKGSEDIASERSENRHLRRPYTHLMPPLQQTPANIQINLILLETTFPGLQFCRWQCIGSSSNFRTVLSESQKRQLIIVAEPETDFYANWSFKVIYFDVTEEPLWDYMAQYNNCGIRCGGSEDIACKISENRHFWRPHSHLKPLASEPL